LNWETYKARCDSPEVWSRWMLLQTIELIGANAELAVPLRRALASKALEKPPAHKGGAVTDMFVLRCSATQAESVAALVHRAVRNGAETSGTRGRGLGGFLEAWREYQRFLAVNPRQAPTAHSPPASVAPDSSTCSPKP